MAETWIDANHPDGIPPDLKAKARFGNPAFRTWHARLVKRSYGIVKCCLDCHRGCIGGNDTELDVLMECSKKGYGAASTDENTADASDSSSNEQETIDELRAYLHDAFGHPIRIDYGTGHESSFVVFLLALCKIGCFTWRSGESDAAGAGATDGGHSPQSQSKPAPSPQTISRSSLSLFHAYLSGERVHRGLGLRNINALP